MNDLLQLKGRFVQAKNPSRPGPSNIPAGKSMDVAKLIDLRDDLVRLRDYWIKDDIFPGALISVYYNKVAAKSNRIKALLSGSGQTANSSIVGARFSKDESPKHIITHYVLIEVIDSSIKWLGHCIKIINTEFEGKITHETIKKINENDIVLATDVLAKNKFINVIVDSCYVEKFDVFIDEDVEWKSDSIITIFKTDVKTIELMEKIGIKIHFTRVMEGTTVLLMPDQLAILKQKAPYLISMAVIDVKKLDKSDFEFNGGKKLNIPAPNTEPVIGVIDTMFHEKVYFSEWVEFMNMLPKDIDLSSNDYDHGTAVSSIIVDGPASNPKLDDGCGRFRVRHFGVAAGNQFSSFTILRNIKEIVSSNKDVKVWNLSLGSNLEINPNFISPEAAFLDKIQSENDVIFVIAGTNKSFSETKEMRIGAPADSINSIVVNSVDFKNQPASYSRQGPVLSFFTKPDISYYGGDNSKRMRACTPAGEAFVQGTSFAAPWIARKMSYLIDILGLSREVAKALLINSATGWKEQELNSFLSGHGIVPIRIEDVVRTPDDEIQFVLSGVSEKYETYNYNIPVPLSNDKHPFNVKATLCYFPSCSRNQGVDYTNTELDMKLGRLKDKSIKSIDNNYQNSEDVHRIWEKDARKLFRKWDNVKHIREIVKERNVPRMSYGNGLWGLNLKTKERLDEKYGVDLKFGIVITLKAMDGVNRIDEFIKNCSFRNWLVNRIDVEQRVNIYNIAEEEIDFTE